MAQEEDLYAALVRSPRFASEVGNVVVEFGDAAQQQTLDRYLSGEDVPFGELRKVWADTVGWLPTVTSLGYINFFAVGQGRQSEADPRASDSRLARRPSGGLDEGAHARRNATGIAGPIAC